MASREQIEQKTENLLKPIMDEHQFELVDVEYVKEGNNWYLRAYIDKDGGITIDDCELVSRAFSELLDQNDYIQTAYILEVSSPGLLRPLKKERDFIRHMNEPVELHLYKARNKSKEFQGILRGYTDQSITIEIDDEVVTFEKSEIALIRRAFEWDY